METIAFKEMRNAYEQQREKERRKLSDFLTEYIEKQGLNLEVIKGGRAGKVWLRYSSGGKFASYDLSNWKWVEIIGMDSNFSCIVSLNMPEFDPNSGNAHVLFDRIGLLISFPDDQLYYETEIFTDIDLPFDDDKKLERVAALVKEQFEFYRNKK